MIINPAQQRLFAKRTRSIYWNQDYRAKKAKASLGYTLIELRQCVKNTLEAGLCPYCSCELTLLNFSVDHMDPVSRGGALTLENLLICCRACNEAKSALTASEFDALLAVVHCWPGDVRKRFLARLRAGGRVIKGG